jgi:hypothetical protein
MDIRHFQAGRIRNIRQISRIESVKTTTIVRYITRPDTFFVETLEMHPAPYPPGSGFPQ